MGKLKTIAILIIGWLFVGLGVLGLFLPILQGVLFILIGLGILSSRSHTVRRFLKYLEGHYPKQYGRAMGMKEKIHNWFKRFYA